MQEFTFEQKHAARRDPVMLDLETLGTGANSAIIAIGAVKFDPEKMLITDNFYRVVDRESCFRIGMTYDQDTLDWWAKQSPEAKTVLTQPGVSINEAIHDFASWIHPKTQVWGNGSDFDNVMVAETFRKHGKKLPWQFWNNRCYRTMKNMFPSVPLVRRGVHHHAVDDAETQAIHLMQILSVMRAGQRALG